MNGYIKLFRKFIKWEWYGDANTKALFIHCLLRANHEDKKWKGLVIKKGSFITGRKQLAKELAMSESQVRTSLNHLKLTKELTISTTARYSIITVNNWDDFQKNDQVNDQPIAKSSPSNDHKQEYKELKEIKEEIEEERTQKKFSFVEPDNISNGWFGEYRNVHLSEEQYGKLLSMIANKHLLNEIIEALSENIAVKHPNAPLYDESRPWMHFVILKRYWTYRKLNPRKFNDSEKSDSKADELDKKIEEEIRKKDKEFEK